MVLIYNAYNETIEDKQNKDKGLENKKSDGFYIGSTTGNIGFAKVSCEHIVSIEAIVCPHDILIRYF